VVNATAESAATVTRVDFENWFEKVRMKHLRAMNVP